MAPDLMQLWTIQPVAVWELLQHDRVLRAIREHVIQSAGGEHFLPAYDWLREQMGQRVGPPPEPDIYPMWAYFQFENVKHRRPDLRRVRSWHPQGEKQALLELEVNEDRVLLSDMSGWLYVLNDLYLPSSLADAQAFETANYSSELAHEFKRQSWSRSLDLNFFTPEPDIALPCDEKTIQATMWELRLEDVVGVRCFAGNGSRARFSG